MTSTTPPSDPLPGTSSRIFSEAECHTIAERVMRFARGGGYTVVRIQSTWVGNTRWARNQIHLASDVRDDTVEIGRFINGASSTVQVNDTTDAALVAAMRRAERMLTSRSEFGGTDLVARMPLETASNPSLFSETTCNMGTARRTTVALQTVQPATTAGMLSAGSLGMLAASQALIDSLSRSRFLQYTSAQYTVSVRDPGGIGSGWAGADAPDWSRIDAAAVAATALAKCFQSRHPVTIEPGRYTTILEPQAVSDFVGQLMADASPLRGPREALRRSAAERMEVSPTPFGKTPGDGDRPGYSKLGERVVDPRITISTDPMDPENAYPPFDVGANSWYDWFLNPVYHPTKWIEQGVLTSLYYDRLYAIRTLGQSTGLPNSGAFRMSGGGTTIEEMIATTKRGLLVTRFDEVDILDINSQLFNGVTRDGLWFIENGKVSKPVKNMRFVESILFALNNVEQLGVPQRVFRPPYTGPFGILSRPLPAIVPPLKIRDFSFTALIDAV